MARPDEIDSAEELNEYGEVPDAKGVPLTSAHDPDDHDSAPWASHHTLGQDHLQAAHGDHPTTSHPDWTTAIAGLVLNGVTGPTGPPGPIGPAGPTGATGPAGIVSQANIAKYGVFT